MTENDETAALKRHPMPFTRIEICVASIMDGVLSVLMAKREQAPYAGRWALPGGVVRIDLDEDLEAAAQRVAEERLKTPLPFLRQLCAVGGMARDPRAPWALSIVYRGLLPEGAFEPKAGKRIEALQWHPVEKLILDPKLAFDHGRLIQQAIAVTRAEIEALNLPFGFLPEPFTLGELQALCEVILGRRLDKSSFRRRLDERQLIEPVPGEMRTGPFRPAQLFRKR